MSTQQIRAQLLSRLHEHEERAEFRASASKLLMRTSRLVADGLDVEGTLARVARLALPHPGVWSIVELCDGATKRRVVAHPVPKQQAVAQALLEEWSPSRDVFGAHARVMRTGASGSIAHVTDAMLIHVAESPDQLRLLRELGIGSILIVCMASAGNPIGSLTFIGPRLGRAFDEDDRVLAEGIAAGAALAITNARTRAPSPLGQSAVSPA